MASSYDKIDRLALLMVRQGKEKSRALEQRYYGDPAKSVVFESERIEREEREKKRNVKK